MGRMRLGFVGVHDFSVQFRHRATYLSNNNEGFVKGWHKTNDSKTVIVFIHGLFSDAKECWTSKCGTFWPDLLFEDPRFNNPSIFLAEFFTQAGSNDYGLQECANEVYQLLLREDNDLNSPPIEKERIVFVTHSTGGIVCRYILEAYRDDFVGKQIGLCLFASPSYGSKISSTFGFVARMFNNKLAQELCWGSHILHDLDGRFSNLLHSKKLSISGMEAIENRAPFNIPFIKTRVVEELSGARYFGKRKIIAASDHSSIVKPINHNSDSHQALLDFLVAEGFFDCRSKPSTFTYPSLFDRYVPKVEDYYIKRSSDEELKNMLSQYSLWVWGESGVGKTASITRAISKQIETVKYISLGACIGDSAQDLIRIIYSHLDNRPYEEINSLHISNCIDLISLSISARCKEDNFYLFIEEIPITEEDVFLEFSNYIYTLIANIGDTNGFRLILTSIFSPNTNISPELQKITERLKVVEWRVWEVADIEILIKVISDDVGLLLGEGIFPDRFNNNPRAVKNYYRDELAKLVKRR